MNDIEKSTQTNHYFEYRQVDNLIQGEYNLAPWIKQEIIDKQLKILDYGCGFGQNLQALKNNNYQHIYGVDIEKEAIKNCLLHDFIVKELNIKKIANPFEFKFDVIILNHIIEHIPKNEIIDTLSFIKNHFLSDNGKLLISVPNAQSNTDCYWAYEDWTHTTLFTSGSLYYILKAAGFEHIEFIDIDCTLGSSMTKSLIRKFLLSLYRKNKKFWNKVTCSSYHNSSPVIFSYEIKVKVY